MQEDSNNKDGVPWWQLGGTARRIAAYLWFNVEVGDTFTMAEVRNAAQVEQQTQSDRRLRELREQGWEIVGYKDDPSLKPNHYRLESKGQRLWLGEKVVRDAISNKLRRMVFDRDNHTCVICGVTAGEPYPDLLSDRARMTVGHRVPNQRLGDASLENLQTECSRCNETVRNLLDDPETLKDVLPFLEALSKDQLLRLHDWLIAGRKMSSDLDIAYARIRRLNKNEQSKTLDFLDELIKELD